MKVLIRIVPILLVCYSINGAYIGDRMAQQNLRELYSPRYHSSLTAEEGLRALPVIIQTAGFVFDKFGAVAKFMRKYNALPRVANCLKIILNKFNAGRQFLMHYNLVKAKNEGPKLLASNLPAAPPQLMAPVRIIPSPLTLPRNRAAYIFRSLPYSFAPGFRTLPFRKPTCTCSLRRGWKRVNYFQNRRKKWPRRMKPFRIKPTVGFVAAWPRVTIPTSKMTVSSSKRLMDILANPNQIPYYANLALDVFDTHFESWNAKIKTVYNAVKQKLEKTIDKNESSAEYDNYVNGTENNSNDSSSSEYDYSTDQDNSTSVSSNESVSSSGTDESESYSDSHSSSNSDEESSYSDETNTSEGDDTNKSYATENDSSSNKRDRNSKNINSSNHQNASITIPQL